MILRYFECSAVSEMNDVGYYVQYMGAGRNRGYQNICDKLNMHLGEKVYSVCVNCQSVSDLENKVISSLKKDRPVIASLDCKSGYYTGKPDGAEMSHYIVIFGIYEKDNVTYFKIRDPAKRGVVNVTSKNLYAAMPCQKNGYQHPIVYGILDNAYKNLDSISRIAFSIKSASGEDQCYIKEKPFEDSNDKSPVVPKGNIIKIVGAVKNKHGNIWYKTEDGGFVYSGDIIFYQDYFSISAKFKNTERRSSHKLPFVDSDEVKKIGKDDVVQVSKFVLNSYGNIWAQLTDGSYLCFYDKETGENKLQFSAHVTNPSISGASKPTGDRTVGTSFTMKGVITAEVPFLSVSSRLIDRETEKDAEGPNTPITAKPTVSTRSVDIGKNVNGVNIDTSTKFNKLGKGWYRYEINAQFGFTYEGKTFTFGGEKNFISSNFSVGKAGQTEPPSLTDPFAKFQTLFTLSAKFKNTEKRNSHKAPYLDSPEVKKIGKDDVVEVTEFVTNSYGNVWAKLTDGSYLCFYDKETGENKLQFSGHVTQPSHTTVYPQGDIKVTSTTGFVLKGDVKAEVPFLSLTARVVDRETEKDVSVTGSPCTLKPAANTRTINLLNTKIGGKSMDDIVLIRKLYGSSGWYRYELNAQFGFTYEGKTFKFGNGYNYVSSDFTVGNPGTLETVPTPEPPGGEEEPPAGDIGARVPGDANEDGFVDIFDALLVLQYDAGWDVQINTSNGDVNADGIADIFDALLLLQYDAGWDVVLQ